MTKPPETIFHYFLVSLSPPPPRTIVLGSCCFFSLQLLEHHVLWLENLFEVLKNFDVPII